VNPVAAERLPGLLGHELRNPLASAVTGAMLARETTDDDDPRAAVLDGVLRDLDRLTGLLDGWLRLARNGRVARRTVGVADLVRSVAVRHAAQLVVCPDELAVHGDRVMLERVLDNLCENARHAGARTVRIGVQAIGTDVVLHVEDDGKGVAAERRRTHLRARLVEPRWCRPRTLRGRHDRAGARRQCALRAAAHRHPLLRDLATRTDPRRRWP
jgi:signal transduction histidine kinase